MPRTYEPIASQTLGSDTSSLTFSSIPTTYTDLILVCSSQTTAPSASGLRGRINGDTASNYSTTALDGNGSSATSGRASNDTSIALGNHGAANRSPFVVHFMSYSNTNVFMTALSAWATPEAFLGRHVLLYRSTSAMTSLTLFESNGTYKIKAGSTFSLYGIKAA